MMIMPVRTWMPICMACMHLWSGEHAGAHAGMSGLAVSAAPLLWNPLPPMPPACCCCPPCLPCRRATALLPSGDKLLSQLLWQAGVAYTDPGLWWFHSSGRRGNSTNTTTNSIDTTASNIASTYSSSRKVHASHQQAGGALSDGAAPTGPDPDSNNQTDTHGRGSSDGSNDGDDDASASAGGGPDLISAVVSALDSRGRMLGAADGVQAGPEVWGQRLLAGQCTAPRMCLYIFLHSLSSHLSWKAQLRRMHAAALAGGDMMALGAGDGQDQAGTLTQHKGMQLQQTQTSGDIVQQHKQQQQLDSTIQQHTNVSNNGTAGSSLPSPFHLPRHADAASLVHAARALVHVSREVERVWAHVLRPGCMGRHYRLHVWGFPGFMHASTFPALLDKLHANATLEQCDTLAP